MHYKDELKEEWLVIRLIPVLHAGKQVLKSKYFWTEKTAKVKLGIQMRTERYIDIKKSKYHTSKISNKNKI
jgi:hypothetical protein